MGGSWGLGSGPERAPPGPAPRQPGSEPLPGPPCCCTPPRSCPAPGESACRAARSSSWRRRSRALHTCRSPSVCRAGTWWRRRGRSADRDGSGLRRAGAPIGKGAWPGTQGSEGRRGGGGQGRPSPEEGPQRQTTRAEPNSQFQTCFSSDDSHLPFETPPRPPGTEATRPSQRRRPLAA